MSIRIILALIVLLALLGSMTYFFIPKTYDTVTSSKYGEGFLLNGETCECLGFKNETEKQCIGFIYSCKKVR